MPVDIGSIAQCLMEAALPGCWSRAVTCHAAGRGLADLPAHNLHATAELAIKLRYLFELEFRSRFCSSGVAMPPIQEWTVSLHVQ